MTAVLLHGFMGSPADWTPLLGALGAGPFCVPNLPGHGTRPWPPDCHSLAAAADVLVAELPPLFDLAGYSLGGRLALVLALRHPTRVRRLALLATSAGLADGSERRGRRLEDARRARQLRGAGLEAFLAEWEKLPLFAGRAALPKATQTAWRARRLAQDPRALARALVAFSPGKEPALSHQLATLPMPTLWIAGSADARYARAAPQLAALMPRADHVLVPGATHDLLAECPLETAALLATHFADPHVQPIDPEETSS